MSPTTARSVTLLQSLTLVVLSCSLAFAQSFTATVRGTAKDPSGASVPLASVTITDVDRGTSQTTMADEEGRFAITALPPGQYVLTVEAAGFKKFSSGRFTLTVQQQATVDARLDVGAVNETVEVSASAAQVNTTIANLGQVIDNQTIVSLPNLGRNPMAFTYLTPGVVGSGGRPGDSNTNFVANGSRNSTSDVLLDGVTVVTVEQNSGVTDLKYSPAVDAVQEFKVQTNFFSAEFGQTGGAVVNMVTKSGTNKFDGTGYYFLRHSELNANNWFSNRAGPDHSLQSPRSGRRRARRPADQEQDLLLRAVRVHRVEEPAHVDPDRPDAAAKTGRLLADPERRRAGDDDLQPLRHLRERAGEPRTAAVRRERHSGGMIDPIALKALNYFPLPNARARRSPRPTTGSGRAFTERQSSDEHQAGSELHGAEPADRPLQLWSVHQTRHPICSVTWARRFHSTTARSSGASIPSSPSSRGRRVRRRCGACATG